MEKIERKLRKPKEEQQKHIEDMEFYEENLFEERKFQILNDMNNLLENGYTNIEQQIKIQYQLNDNEYREILTNIQRKILKK